MAADAQHVVTWKVMLIDQATKSLGRLGRNVKKETEAAKTAFDRMGASIQRATSKIGAMGLKMLKLAGAVVGITGITMAMQGMVRAVRSGIRDAIKFSKGMAEVSTISKDVHQNLAEVSQAVLDLSTRFGMNETDTARALYQAISAGVTETADAFALLDAAVVLSIGGLADIESTINLLTNTINAYGMSVGEVEHINNVFFETVRLGKTTIPEMADSLAVAIPIAAAVGVEFEELSAMLATLTKGGVNTTTAVVFMRQAMISILRPSADAQKLMRDNNIEFGAAKVAAGGFVGQLIELREKLGDNMEAWQEFFPNVRAFVPVLALAGNQFEEFTHILKRLESAAMDEAVPALNALERISLSAGRKIETMGNAVRQGVMQLGLGLIEGLTGPIDTMGELEAAALTIREAIGGLVPVVNTAAGAMLTMVSVFPSILGGMADVLESLADTPKWLGGVDVAPEKLARLRQAASGMEQVGIMAREMGGALMRGDSSAGDIFEKMARQRDDLRLSLIEGVIEAEKFGDAVSSLDQLIVKKSIKVFGVDVVTDEWKPEEAALEVGDYLTGMQHVIGGGLLKEDISSLMDTLGGEMSDGLKSSLEYFSSQGAKTLGDAFEQVTAQAGGGGGVARENFDLNMRDLMATIREMSGRSARALADAKVSLGRDMGEFHDEIALALDAKTFEAITSRYAGAWSQGFAKLSESGREGAESFIDVARGLKEGGLSLSDQFEAMGADGVQWAITMSGELDAGLAKLTDDGGFSKEALKALKIRVSEAQRKLAQLGGKEMVVELERIRDEAEKATREAAIAMARDDVATLKIAIRAAMDMDRLDGDLDVAEAGVEAALGRMSDVAAQKDWLLEVRSNPESIAAVEADLKQAAATLALALKDMTVARIELAPLEAQLDAAEGMVTDSRERMAAATISVGIAEAGLGALGPLKANLAASEAILYAAWDRMSAAKAGVEAALFSPDQAFEDSGNDLKALAAAHDEVTAARAAMTAAQATVDTDTQLLGVNTQKLQDDVSAAMAILATARKDVADAEGSVSLVAIDHRALAVSLADAESAFAQAKSRMADSEQHAAPFLVDQAQLDADLTAATNAVQAAREDMLGAQEAMNLGFHVDTSALRSDLAEAERALAGLLAFAEAAVVIEPKFDPADIHSNIENLRTFAAQLEEVKTLGGKSQEALLRQHDAMAKLEASKLLKRRIDYERFLNAKSEADKEGIKENLMITEAQYDALSAAQQTAFAKERRLVELQFSENIAAAREAEEQLALIAASRADTPDNQRDKARLETAEFIANVRQRLEVEDDLTREHAAALIEARKAGLIVQLKDIDEAEVKARAALKKTADEAGKLFDKTALGAMAKSFQTAGQHLTELEGQLEAAKRQLAEMVAASSVALNPLVSDETIAGLEQMIALFERVTLAEARTAAKTEEFNTRVAEMSPGMRGAQQGVQAWTESVGDMEKMTADITQGALQDFSTALAGTFTDIVIGAKSSKEAFTEFGKSMMMMIIQIITKVIALTIVSAVLKALGFPLELLGAMGSAKTASDVGGAGGESGGGGDVDANAMGGVVGGRTTPFTPFADGGVVPGGLGEFSRAVSSTKVTPFADGGVVPGGLGDRSRTVSSTKVTPFADGGVVPGGLGEFSRAVSSTKVTPFANGGIAMGGLGRVIPYATGGPIVTEPHVALIGEGKSNEAIVPLPDGKSIPVRMSGGGGGSTAISFNITAVDAKGIDQLLMERRDTIRDLIHQAMMEDRLFRSTVSSIAGGR